MKMMIINRMRLVYYITSDKQSHYVHYLNFQLLLVFSETELGIENVAALLQLVKEVLPHACVKSATEPDSIPF